MIKVCYIYRRKFPNGRQSIEKVFQAISANIPGDQFITEEFICGKNLFKTVYRLRKVKADIYHITGHNNYIAFFIPFRKKIITVHDVYHWMHDLKGWRKFIFGLLYYYFPARLCDAITAISEEVKQDLIKHFRFREKDILTIQNPLSQRIPHITKTFDPGKPVILQIGYNPHKNLANLIEAVKGLKCRLEIIGCPANALVEKMKGYNIEYNIQYNLGKKELEEKYAQADIIFFASLYEGFGLPLLEAQSAGRPLITSNISPMKEVAGEGALLVDPSDPLQIRNAILRITGNAGLRNRLVSAGFENIKNYDPAIISQQYAAVYRQLTNNRREISFKEQPARKKIETVQ